MSHSHSRNQTFRQKLKTAASCLTLGLSLYGTAHAAGYEYSPTYQPNLAQIGVDKTWHDWFYKTYIAPNARKTKVVVAILDGKADVGHVDLKGRISVLTVYSGSYRTPDTHGTHVSGIVGAARNNAGIVGVNPYATLLSIPVFDTKGWVATDLGKKALDAAKNAGARVVNMSYGPTAAGDVFLTGELALFKAYNSSMVLVRAAGNNGANAISEAYTGNASVDLSGLLIVGSVGANNTISTFSNRPSNACIGACGLLGENAMKNFWLVAPGENILSDLPKNTIGYMSGTSMAAPHVAGAASLVYQYALAGNTNLSPGDVAEILKCTAKDLGVPGVDSVYGWGLLDVQAALEPCGIISLATGNTVGSGVVAAAASAITTSSLMGSRAMENALSGMMVLDEYKRAFVVEQPKLSPSLSSVFSTNFVQELSGQVGASTTEVYRDGQNVVSLTSQSDFTHGGFRTMSVDRGGFHYDAGLGAAASYYMAIESAAAEKPFSRAMAEHFFTGSSDAAIPLNQSMFFGSDWKTASRLTLSALHLRTAPSAFESVPDHVAAVMWDQQRTSSLTKLGVRYELSDSLSAGLSYGLLQEQGQLLGMQAGGAFSMGDGLTHIGTANLNAEISPTTSLSILAEQSRTSGNADHGTIFSIAEAWSGSKYGISLSQSEVFGMPGVFRLTLVRPWKIDQGSLGIHLPVGRELDGTVNYDNRIVSMAQDHTPWEMRLGYLRGNNALTYGGELRMLDRMLVDQTIREVSLAAALRWSF